MKARLEPRIVAARIHGAAPAEQGAAAGEERITPLSHGCGIKVARNPYFANASPGFQALFVLFVLVVTDARARSQSIPRRHTRHLNRSIGIRHIDYYRLARRSASTMHNHLSPPCVMCGERPSFSGL